MPAAAVAWLVVAQMSSRGPVQVAKPANSAQSRQACATMKSALPQRLDDRGSRTVVGDTRVSAAWGNPPIILRCGLIAAPSPVGDLATLNGVDWAPVAGKHSVTWTTIGRTVTVQVQVPSAYDSQAPILAELSPAITAALPPKP